MMHRTVYVYSKPLMPVLMGLCIGIALSLILVPLLEEQCHSTSLVNPLEGVATSGAKFPTKAVSHPSKVKIRKSQANRRTKSFPNDDQMNVDYWNSEIFEPRRKNFDPQLSPEQNANAQTTKILRPRYISTELGIREKLFVGVLSSKNTLETFAVAINKTLNHLVPKLVFFMNSRGPNLPPGMSMVIFSDEKPHVMPFHMFKYISDHYVKSYDWFYFMHDSTYVRGDKLFDLAQFMSVVHTTVLGRPVPASAHSEEGKLYCDMGSGILMSQSALSQVVQHLDWCIKNAYPTQQDTENVGRCIVTTTKLNCSDTFNDKKYATYHSSNFDFQRDIPDVRSQEDFNRALSVQHVHTDLDIYRLHRYYCEEELKITQEKLQKTKQEIKDVAPKTPTGNNSLTWPIGVDPPSVPKTRFDVINWQYFTENHLYLDSDFSNRKPLKGVDKEDVQDIIKVSMDRLNKRHNNRFTFKSLINGYRHFDATRGMDYILDILLGDRVSRTEIEKRVYLTRPLGSVEIIPMPYVTENTRVNLILPVMAEDRDSVMSILDSYAHTCLESGDNTHLFVVFVYQDNTEDGEEDDVYSVLKSMITFYENKYQNGAKIAWTAVHSASPTQYTIMDAVSRKFPPESLLLLCSVGMELSIEFLNRVRMNTIAQWQVYFPIGFWQYKPNLVYTEKPYPTNIEIKRGMGHYDIHSYAHTSFFNSDYQYARKQMISTSASRDLELYDMFLKYHTVHIFRAVEPALKLHFRLKTCTPSLHEEAYAQCLASKGEGLASRSQLAMLIFEYQQKLDQMQLNVMHQQNGQNVEQMKPDMLRK